MYGYLTLYIIEQFSVLFCLLHVYRGQVHWIMLPVPVQPAYSNLEGETVLSTNTSRLSTGEKHRCKNVLKNFVFNIMFVASGDWMNVPYLLAFKLQIVSAALRLMLTTIFGNSSRYLTNYATFGYMMSWGCVRINRMKCILLNIYCFG